MDNAGATLIATHAGIRGRPGVGLTDEIVSSSVMSMVDLLEARGVEGALGVARDARPSGGALLGNVVETLAGLGVDVVDFGVVSTPTAKLAARQAGLGGVVVVTGSHLGADWNGLKLMAGPDFKPLDVGALCRPREELRRGLTRGHVSRDDTAAEHHAAALCAAADVEAVRAAGLRVRLEGGAGAAGSLALAELGCRISHGRADIALILDGDGDRLELVDEQRRALDSEATLCLAALGAGAHTIVKGADTSCMIDLVMAERGGRVVVTQPGELHLLEGVEATGAELAGEGNGGVVVPDVGMARDGLAAAMLILGLMARTGATVSSLAAGLPRLSRRRLTIPCPDESRARSALQMLARRMGQPFEGTRQGVLVQSPDAAWGLVRQSATEPVLRVTVEAREPAQAESLEAELRAGLAGTG